MPVVSTTHPATSKSVFNCHTAHFTTTWTNPSTALIAVHGEIDAVNAIQFVDYALREADRMKDLVVDLTGVEFFGSAGFSALHTLNLRCIAAGIVWALTPSKAVSRLLRICDTESTLPIRRSADVGEPRRLLQLVAESR